MVASIAVVLVLLSFILFITGFLGIAFRPIQTGLKAIHKNFRLRHLLLGSILSFSLGFAIAWENLPESCKIETKNVQTEVQITG